MEVRGKLEGSGGGVLGSHLLFLFITYFRWEVPEAGGHVWVSGPSPAHPPRAARGLPHSRLPAVTHGSEAFLLARDRGAEITAPLLTACRGCNCSAYASVPPRPRGQSSDLTLLGQQQVKTVLPRGRGMAWMTLVCLRSPESCPFSSELVTHPPSPFCPKQSIGAGAWPRWAGAGKGKWQRVPCACPSSPPSRTHMLEKVVSEDVAAVASSWRRQKSPSPSAGPV